MHIGEYSKYIVYSKRCRKIARMKEMFANDVSDPCFVSFHNSKETRNFVHAQNLKQRDLSFFFFFLLSKRAIFREKSRITFLFL